MTGQNFGMSGYGGVGSLLLMRRALGLKPRVVVYGFWEDHLNRNVEACLESGMPFCTPRPIISFASSKPEIELPEDPFGALASARKWYGHSGPSVFKGVVAAASRNWAELKALLHPGSAKREPSRAVKIEAAIFVLKAMKINADRAGAKLVVVYIPGSEDLPPRIREYMLNADIHLVDMGPRLEQMRKAGVPTQIPNDGHMTAEVHHAIAEEVAKIIR